MWWIMSDVIKFICTYCIAPKNLKLTFSFRKCSIKWRKIICLLLRIDNFAYSQDPGNACLQSNIEYCALWSLIKCSWQLSSGCKSKDRWTCSRSYQCTWRIGSHSYGTLAECLLHQEWNAKRSLSSASYLEVAHRTGVWLHICAITQPVVWMRLMWHAECWKGCSPVLTGGRSVTMTGLYVL